MASSGGKSNGNNIMDHQQKDGEPSLATQFIKVEGGGAKSLLINSQIPATKSVGTDQQTVNVGGSVAKVFTIAKSEMTHAGSGEGPHSLLGSTQTPTRTISISKGGIVHQQVINSGSPQKILTVPGTPPRQIVSATRLTLSPAKSPAKYTVISAGTKSPHKILQPGQIVSMVSQAGLTALPQGATKTVMSPSKVFVRGATPPGSQFSTAVRTVASSSNMQSHTMQGSKFQYVRLVSAPSSQNTVTQHRALAPAPAKSLLHSQPVSVSSNHGRVPIQPLNQTSKVLPSQNQRVILPATNQVPIRPQMPNIAPRPQSIPSSQNLSSLPPGTTIIQGSQSLPGVQGFALVPAQYVTQLQQQPSSQPQQQLASHNQTVIPKPSDSAFAQSQSSRMPRTLLNGPASVPPPDASSQRPRKPCNCTKSQCLKLYCDCFANGEFCNNCNCNNCYNNLEHEEERGRAIKACLDRNPQAFKPKIGKGRGETADRRHNKGCNCKRSGCLKNYCECYEAKILCSSLCKCVGCKNYEEAGDNSKSMNILSTSNSAEDRTTQHGHTTGSSSSIVKSKSISHHTPIQIKPTNASGGRLPYSFVTNEVAEATCMCLVAQAEESERTHQIQAVQERMILEEFGRCLMQVIDSANKTKAPSPVP